MLDKPPKFQIFVYLYHEEDLQQAPRIEEFMKMVLKRP